MIRHRKQFNINHKCVIEMLLIDPPFRLSGVFHNEACFLYFREGKTLFNAPTEHISLDRKEGLLLKCGNYIAEFLPQLASDYCEVYAIHLYPEVLREIYQNEIPSFLKEENPSPLARKIAGHSIIDRFIDSLIFYFENPELVNEELLRLKLRELMLLLLQTDDSETVLSLFSKLFTPRKSTITEIMSTYLFSCLTVGELAILCGLSLSSFKREFYKLYHDTPANFIKSKRLLKASELLAVSDMSIAEICYQVGFSDPSHFSRSFRRQFRCGPNAYRKKQAGLASNKDSTS